MAITLSSSLSSTVEPMRKNRWIFQFTTVPGNTNAEGMLAFAAHSATIPNMTFAPVQKNRLNEAFWVAGKPVWNEIGCTFYDYIDGVNSAGQILYNWSQLIYNPITGQMFFKKQYSTSATMAQLDPAGAIVRLWNMFYIWPSIIGFGESVSYDEDAISEVNATFKYDYALKATDVNTSV
jgi:hypothetical protein